MREEVKVEWEDLPENTNPNLKYFGYFHADGFGGYGECYDVIDGLQNSNVYVVNSAWNADQLIQDLELARARGMKVWGTLHGGRRGTGLWIDGGQEIFDSNIWDYFEASLIKLQPYLDDGTLLGLYFDEPMWNGTTHEQFIQMTKFIREKSPNMRIMNCMTVYDLGFYTIKRESDGAVYQPITAEVNQYVTDVMYDYYGDWDVKERQDLLNRLKAVATNNQWIWGCATGFVDANKPKLDNGKRDTLEMKKAIIGMYKEAINEPRYAGILNFTIVSTIAFINKGEEYYDLSVKKLNINVGRKIIGLGKIDITE
jgi:hypothetical protein